MISLNFLSNQPVISAVFAIVALVVLLLYSVLLPKVQAQARVARARDHAYAHAQAQAHTWAKARAQAHAWAQLHAWAQTQVQVHAHAWAQIHAWAQTQAQEALLWK